MNIGNRIFTKVDRAPKELVELFRGIPSSNINDEMNRLYCMHDYIHLMNPDSAVQLLGTALTVKCPAGDNLMMHQALDLAQPGDIIVVDGDSGCNRSLAGEIMMRFSEGKGIAGWVCDGAIRDVDGCRTIAMPVYATGVTPQGPWKFGPGEINVPIACGGQVVFPGDILVGDADGVVVIHKEDAQAVAALAKKHFDMEAGIMELIENDFQKYIENHVASTAQRMAKNTKLEINEKAYFEQYGK